MTRHHSPAEKPGVDRRLHTRIPIRRPRVRTGGFDEPRGVGLESVFFLDDGAGDFASFIHSVEDHGAS